MTDPKILPTSDVIILLLQAHDIWRRTQTSGRAEYERFAAELNRRIPVKEED